jgi:hypothetical protein
MKKHLQTDRTSSSLIRNHRRRVSFSPYSVIRSCGPPPEARFYAKIDGSIV